MGPRQDSLDVGIPDEPPPAYAETSGQSGNDVLDAGPRYPFGFSDEPESSYTPPPVPPPRPAPALPPRAESREPTTVPTPGRVLLHGGKVLAYPQGYECGKCHNVGYKNNDPSHPCKKCWEKYGRPWNVVRLAPDAGNLSQRPLPGRPPSSQNPSPASSHRPSTPPHHPYQDARLHQSQQGPSQPPWGAGPYPPQANGPFHGPGPYGPAYGPAPISGPFGPSSGPYGPAYGPGPSQAPGPNGRPLVVQPGDPRIGGRMCPTCGGYGRTSGRQSFGGFVDYMFGGAGDEVCLTCRGVGRIF